MGTAFSAVSSRPQTTRRNIKGIHSWENEEDQWAGQLVFVDTPGLNFKRGLLDRFMHSQVEEALEGVDIAVWVSTAKNLRTDLKDLAQGRPGIDRVADWISRAWKVNENTKWILVLSKCDRLNSEDILQILKDAAEYAPQFEQVVPVAAMRQKRGSTNIPELLSVMQRLAPEGEPMFPKDDWTDLSSRALMENLLREAMFEHLREEAPYESEQTVVDFKEPNPKEGRHRPEIMADLWVSKASLKPIIVGKGGQKLKEIGTQVRQKYETITGERIILKLFVKVVEEWPLHKKHLKVLGYDVK
jgi:GTP-binding protein Era